MDDCLLTYEQPAESLEQKACDRQTVTYNELAAELGLARVNNMFANHPLSAFFEQIDAVDSLERQPFRTALVVQKATAGLAADFLGLFRCCVELRSYQPTKSRHGKTRSISSLLITILRVRGERYQSGLHMHRLRGLRQWRRRVVERRKI
jgi:hypothetical protein